MHLNTRDQLKTMCMDAVIKHRLVVDVPKQVIKDRQGEIKTIDVLSRRKSGKRRK